ncbi:unnamed protein product [Urochloa humidicola]
MPPGKPALLQSTAPASRNTGWLSSNSKRPRRADEGDGTPLPDEILIAIFAGFPEIADLVRCAATCRRWRLLVSGEAAFLSRRRRPGRFLPPLALGFFFHHHAVAAAAAAAAAAPRFVPTASASRRFPALRSPELSRLLDSSSSSSRVVASRNGLVVVDLRRGGGDGIGRKNGRALRLCVCNPMTGEAHALPPLTGKDGVGHYVCTVLTADDCFAAPAPPPSTYRLLLVYSRRSFTAFRSYSGDVGGWSPEAKVTGAKLGKSQMGLACNGVVGPGGREAYWLAEGVVFRLRLDTMEASMFRVQAFITPHCAPVFHVDDTRLGFTPEGRLCAVQLDSTAINDATHRRLVRVGITTYGHHGGGGGNYREHEWWKREEEIWVESFSVDNANTLKLRWFCERSGVVFFTVDRWSLVGWGRSEVYAFSIRTRTLEKVVSNGDGRSGAQDAWLNFYG